MIIKNKISKCKYRYLNKIYPVTISNVQLIEGPAQVSAGKVGENVASPSPPPTHEDLLIRPPAVTQ